MFYGRNGMVRFFSTVSAEEAVEIPADAIAGDVVDEAYGQYTWYIDQDGKLMVSGTGDISNTVGLENAEKVSSWAEAGVRWAVGSGLISGIEKDGTKDLAPQGSATRAQMAAILQRFCEANGL